MMEIRNRLINSGSSSMPVGSVRSADEAAAVREIMAEAHTRDAVAALLHLLTRLANCGLDAGAPPLMQSVRSEV
jgi:hypothetical protein